jgi:hypothetical protein
MTPPNFPEQIGKLIPRLGSAFDGEVVATARAIEKTLAGAGLEWFDIVNALTPKQTIPLALARRDWCEKAGYCHRHDHLCLTDAERKFVGDMDKMASGRFRRAPSEKQLAWLDAIYLKVRREAA